MLAPKTNIRAISEAKRLLLTQIQCLECFLKLPIRDNHKLHLTCPLPIRLFNQIWPKFAASFLY